MSGGASPYRFVRELATGGMGRIEIVVKRDGAFARPYARKRLLPRFAKDGEVRAMFVEEARIAGLVRHANVVGVIDVGEDDEGPYLVMDLVDGVSLFDAVDRLRDELPVQVAVEIARQVAEGLHAAHELVAPGGRPLELVHRDVSLANVLVGFDGIARVTDFGVARAVDRGAMTKIGTVKGRLAYMSAEQLEQRALDRRADLYALGVVLAEMLRGGRLHGDTPPEEVARRTLNEPPPDPGELREDLPPALVELTFELLARDREARPPTARVVAQRLLAIVSRLRAEEGAIDVGELMRTHFDDVRKKNAELAREALEDRDGTDRERTPESEPGPAPRRDLGAEPTVIRAAPRGARSPRKIHAALVGVVVGLLVALGLAARFVASREEPTVRLGPAPAPTPPAPAAPTPAAPTQGLASSAPSSASAPAAFDLSPIDDNREVSPLGDIEEPAASDVTDELAPSGVRSPPPEGPTERDGSRPERPLRGTDGRDRGVRPSAPGAPPSGQTGPIETWSWD